MKTLEVNNKTTPKIYGILNTDDVKLFIILLAGPPDGYNLKNSKT